MIKSCNKEELPIAKDMMETLHFLEDLNPCDQAYYQDKGSYLICYKQKADIFNFSSRFSLRKKLKIVGMPYSVVQKGYGGKEKDICDILNSISGLKVILNGDDDLLLPRMYTLPNYVFNNRFSSFEEYLEKLRSHYRYRIKKALKHSLYIEIKAMDPEVFSQEHYDLYREVYQHSADKLECLTIDYFRKYPAKIYEFKDKDTGKILAFVQLKEEDKTLKFLFGGFCRRSNRKYDLYYNMLLKIIQVGIDRGVT